MKDAAAVLSFSRDRGLDGALITAATKSSEPVHQAAQMCRKQGRIVLVGVRAVLNLWFWRVMGKNDGVLIRGLTMMDFI